MTEISANQRLNFRGHWFWPLAFAVCAVNVLVLLLDGWQSPQLKKFEVLFDFAVIIPVLYLICYWKNGKRALIKDERTGHPDEGTGHPEGRPKPVVDQAV
ncbi:MAG: hypothetical protein Tsb0027_01430 [Wenzhouxiangellaceae bacterium]